MKSDAPLRTAVAARRPLILAFVLPALFALALPRPASAQFALDARELARRRFALPLYVSEETFNILALTRDGSGMNFLAKKKLGLIHRGVNPGRLLSRYGGGAGGGTSYNVLEQYTSA